MMEVEQLTELQSLSSDFLSLLAAGSAELGMLSDVSFCVEGRQVHAHRCILAARSHFFRFMFSHQQQGPPLTHQFMNNGRTPAFMQEVQDIFSSAVLAGDQQLVIPVDVVGFDAFSTMLRFLYSGKLILPPNIHQPTAPSSCPSLSCPHSSCSYAVDLLLQLVHAANFFGLNELFELVQTRLGKALEDGVSVESLMRVLVMAKKHRMQRVWPRCVDLIISTGLDCDVLRKYLPREVVAELVDARMQRSAYVPTDTTPDRMQASPAQSLMKSPNSPTLILCGHGIHGSCCSEEQRILRLQQALDCMDVELVRLMVMGEGLDLDKALALHYSVANCSREVVKALLELGVVNVNHSDSLGRTALHLAAGMGNAEMIAVLLDHHANPNAVTLDGFVSVDILRGLMKVGNIDHIKDHHDHSEVAVMSPALCKADQKRLHLCIELLQSAAAVAGREDAAESSSCVTSQASTQIITSQLNMQNQYDPSAIAAANPQLINESKNSRFVRIDSFGHGAMLQAIGQGNRSVQHDFTPSQYTQSAAASSTLPSNHLHQLAGNTALHITPLSRRISLINGDTSSLVLSPPAADQHVNNDSYILLSSSTSSHSYPGIHKDVQSADGEDHRRPAQEGKSTKARSDSPELE